MYGFLIADKKKNPDDNVDKCFEDLCESPIEFTISDAPFIVKRLKEKFIVPDNSTLA